jgi:hypothetical protein
MNWEDVNKKYKDTWLVIEAIKAESNDKKRSVKDVKIIDSFNDSQIAYKKYQELHKKEPSKEMYVVFSNWNELSFEELNWKGLRGQY